MGRPVLTLELPESITQAETIAEAFASAREAAKALKQSQARLKRLLSGSKTPP